jgi:uncharacterized protein (TIGR03437 family)
LTPVPQQKIDRRLAALGLFAIAVYFFRLTRPTLRAGFSPDDCMNLYRAWYFPLSALLKANLLFFLPSDFIRPMGEAWYRAIYFFAGFRAAPFHAVDLALLLVNIFLVYCLARRLAESRFAALAAALLFAYQERWAALYFDTGYIYDVLCGFFLFAALLLYVAVRQRGRAPRAPEFAALLALLVCALNSKELAVALPAAIALYELIYQRRRHFITAAAMALMTIAFIAGRTGTLTANPAYLPQFTWARIMETSAHFLDEIFALSHWFTAPAVLAFAAALLAVGLAARSKPLLFAWGFTVVSALPMAFVPPRGGPQYYVPLFGCALYAGALLAFAERLPSTPMFAFWQRRVAAACVLLAIAWPIYSNGKRVALGEVTSITLESPVVMSLAARLRLLHPHLPHQARLLFLHDPIAPNLEDLLFIVRLAYRDRTMEVERVSRTHTTPTLRQMQAFDAVFDYGAAGLTAVPVPPLALQPRILRFFDADWKPIAPDSPAKAGNRIIALASDLGPTRPEIPLGAPFPREPLATVLLRLEVTVNGTQADVVTQLGAPGEVNVYRFDFILPNSTTSGAAKIRISAAGAMSPAAEIPVAR